MVVYLVEAKENFEVQINLVNDKFYVNLFSNPECKNTILLKRKDNKIKKKKKIGK